jgi:hypothetical protein
MMNDKRTPTGSEPKSFVDAARALECDESEERFDAALTKIAAQQPTRSPDGVIRATWDRPPSYREDGSPKGNAKPSKATKSG